MSRDKNKQKASNARRHLERMRTDLDYRLKRILASMRLRCLTGKSRKDWKWYGAKGLEVSITAEELKAIWFRDEASSMIRPDCDRKENNKGYTAGNVQFIEHADNLRKMIPTRKPRGKDLRPRRSRRFYVRQDRLCTNEGGI